MGTVLEVRLPAGTAGADGAIEAAFGEVSKVEAAASLWRQGTELANVLDRGATGKGIFVSETLGELVRESLEVEKLSGGAFSPAVGTLVAAYDLRGDGRWPSEDERARAVSLARAEGIHYDPATRRLRLDAGVLLDLDGIAKGFALDRAAAALRVRGVDDALLNFGGQLLSVGPPANLPAREAQVASPDASNEVVLSVWLRDASLSTSANSERARTIAGRKAGHLLNPRTGRFARFSGSVSVLAATGALADGLSTAWFVKGPDAWRRTSPGSDLRRAGAAAFVVRDRGGGWETVSDRSFARVLLPWRLALAVTPSS